MAQELLLLAMSAICCALDLLHDSRSPLTFRKRIPFSASDLDGEEEAELGEGEGWGALQEVGLPPYCTPILENSCCSIVPGTSLSCPFGWLQ